MNSTAVNSPLARNALLEVISSTSKQKKSNIFRIMERMIYSLRGGEGTTGVAYDNVSMYFTWESPDSFEELKEFSNDPKKKLTQTTELNTVNKLVLYPEYAHVLMEYQQGGKKKSVSFAFLTINECTDFIKNTRELCKLTNSNENAQGKLELSKEIIGIAGIVLFFTVILIFFHPGSTVHPTKQLVKLVRDLIRSLGYTGTIGIALLLVASLLWKIRKKMKNREKVIEYTK